MINANVARDIQEKAREERKVYEELKSKTMSLVIVAAYTESSSCKLDIPGTYPYKYHIEKLANELLDNGFCADMCLTPEKYSITISW